MTSGPYGSLALGISAKKFCSEYWQKKPLLVRQGLQAAALRERFGSAQEVLSLAGTDTVESRLISQSSKGWQVTHGPLRRIPSLRSKSWTVLVQGLDLVLPSARALLDCFRFIPDARLDDVMVSVASKGGGVGAHLDSYDVFLLQVSGKRRWEIAPPSADYQLRANQPLKLIANFKAQETFELQAGDLLYLPPGWAHNGVAVDHFGEVCMTASVGFRAPSRHEFVSYALQRLAEAVPGDDTRFADPGRNATSEPAQIPSDLARTLVRWLDKVRADRPTTDQLIGEFLSDPKPVVWFEPAPPVSMSNWLKRLKRYGARLDSQSRMLYSENQVFLNGELQTLEADSMVRRLANQRFLTPSDCADFDAFTPIVGALRQWHAYGWLHSGATIESLS